MSIESTVWSGSQYTCPHCGHKGDITYVEHEDADLYHNKGEYRFLDGLGKIHDCTCRNCSGEFIVIVMEDD